jgi:hypothetical protein
MSDVNAPPVTTIPPAEWHHGPGLFAMFSPAPDAPLPVNANNAAVTQEDKLEFSNKADDNKEEIMNDDDDDDDDAHDNKTGKADIMKDSDNEDDDDDDENANNAAVTQEDKLEFSNKADDNDNEEEIMNNDDDDDAHDNKTGKADIMKDSDNEDDDDDDDDKMGNEDIMKDSDDEDDDNGEVGVKEKDLSTTASGSKHRLFIQDDDDDDDDDNDKDGTTPVASPGSSMFLGFIRRYEYARDQQRVAGIKMDLPDFLKLTAEDMDSGLELIGEDDIRGDKFAVFCHKHAFSDNLDDSKLLVLWNIILGRFYDRCRDSLTLPERNIDLQRLLEQDINYVANHNNQQHFGEDSDTPFPKRRPIIHDGNEDNDDDDVDNNNDTGTGSGSDRSDEDDEEYNEEHDGGDDMDNPDCLQPVAMAAVRNRHLIPQPGKGNRSSVVNLYTNGLDPPERSRNHKAQQPVAMDAPGFREALQTVTIPPTMLLLYQQSLGRPRDSFFMSAAGHIKVIATACTMSPYELIKMRGWVFLKKRSLRGAPYRYQTFLESVFIAIKNGNQGDMRKLVYRFDAVLEKMRLQYSELTSILPAPLPVMSRKTSKKAGHVGEPLIKYSRGVFVAKEDMTPAVNYGRKIRNYFEKYHLAIASVNIIFSDCLQRPEEYLVLCDALFTSCHKESSLIVSLHEALRVFGGLYAKSDEAMQSKLRWIAEPGLFMVQVKLKFGKPGVASLEAYESEVNQSFNDLIQRKPGATNGTFTSDDNAILIRYRVLCFYQQKIANSTKINNSKKSKRIRTLPPSTVLQKQPPTLKKLAATSAQPQQDPPVAPRGFLNLLKAQAEAKSDLPAASNPSGRKSFVKFVASGGRGPTGVVQDIDIQVAANPVQTGRVVAIEEDPGPFQLASLEKVKGLGPVLVIIPESGAIDMVLVELSPLDVYYREKLRVDEHSMTYLSSLPSFNELREAGRTFQFYSSKKDYVSNSFAVLRGALQV